MHAGRAIFTQPLLAASLPKNTNAEMASCELGCRRGAHVHEETMLRKQTTVSNSTLLRRAKELVQRRNRVVHLCACTLMAP